MSSFHSLQCHKSREFISKVEAFLVPCKYVAERESEKKDAVRENCHHSCWKMSSTKARAGSYLSLEILNYGRIDKYLHKLLFSTYNVKFN